MYSSGINRMQQLRRRKGNVCSGNICAAAKETESEPAKEAVSATVAETESADKAGLLLADVEKRMNEALGELPKSGQGER